MMIETERLMIREFTLDMAGDVCRNSLDDDNRRFVPDEVFETVEEARNAITFLMSQYGKTEGPLTYPVLTKKDGENIGYVQAVPLGDGTWEIGYHIAQKHAGNGYATEAVRAFLPVAAEMIGTDSIFGICLFDNAASIRVLNKCGFVSVFEGIGEYQGETREIYRSIWKRCPADETAETAGDGIASVGAIKGKEKTVEYTIRKVTIEDYDRIFALWNSTEQSRRALNPVDDSHEGIRRYLERNPNTCFAAVSGERIIGVILTGHDGRRGMIHHMCVHPDFRRNGIAACLVTAAEEALKTEGIQKVFGVVFTDNEPANAFWEKQGYSLRTNLNYRNKSLNAEIPTGE